MNGDRTDFRGNFESGVTHRDYLTLPLLAQAHRLSYGGHQDVAMTSLDA